MVIGCSTLPPPDPVTWRPASIDGPALLIGEVTNLEKFYNPPNADYACHYRADDKNQAKCISNGCGIERITIKTETALTADVPKEVILYNPTGEWCEGADAIGGEFLIGVLPDGSWSAFQKLHYEGQYLLLPDYSGCFGKMDIKHLLEKYGVEVDPAKVPQLGWRRKWTPAISGDCETYTPKELENKALPVNVLLDAWKSLY